MRYTLNGKSVLVTGGTGSLGVALINQILRENPAVVRIYSRDEGKQFELQHHEWSKFNNIRYLIGDVRDYDRLNRAMEGIDVVFHLAAMKHVPSSEYNPFEAVKTNILGTQNVVEAALRNNVERVIYTSTDKAISPTNTMGATKLVAERLVSSADFYKGKSKTVFSAVRFGNVMGSRGSVIPLFKKQIETTGVLTVTDPNMTRFMMTLNQAANLTLAAGRVALGGEVFVLKMPVIRLGDLTEVLIEEYGPLIGKQPEDLSTKIIGLRAGEKAYEELMTVEESKSASEFPDMFAIAPLHVKGRYEYEDSRTATVKNYSSEDESPLAKEQVRFLLEQEGLLS